MLCPDPSSAKPSRWWLVPRASSTECDCAALCRRSAAQVVTAWSFASLATGATALTAALEKHGTEVQHTSATCASQTASAICEQGSLNNAISCSPPPVQWSRQRAAVAEPRALSRLQQDSAQRVQRQREDMELERGTRTRAHSAATARNNASPSQPLAYNRGNAAAGTIAVERDTRRTSSRNNFRAMRRLNELRRRECI